MALPTYVGSGVLGASASTLTPAWPAQARQADDIALLVVESENQTISLSSAQGFVEVTGSPQGSGTAGTSGSNRIAVYWRRLTGAADTAPTIADAGDHVTGRLHVFRGCKTSGNPWNITAGTIDATSDTSGVCPTVTTTVADCLIVLVYGTSVNATGTTNFGVPVNAALANIAERADGSNTIGLGGGHGLATGEKAAAGVVGTSAITYAASSIKGLMTIALEPVTSANVIVTPGLAAVVFAGFAPLAKLAINALAGLASVVFTGFAPTVAVSDHKVLTPGTSAVVYEGHAPTVAIGAATVLQPGTAAVVYTGQAPTVLVTVKIPTGLGQVAFTGFAPSVVLSDNKILAPGVGEVVYTGFAPSVVASVTASPGVASVTFDGFAPAVVLSDNQIVTTGLGEVTFTGFEPSVLVGSGAAALASPGVGQLVFTGFAPSVYGTIPRAVARSANTTALRRTSQSTTGLRRRAVPNATGTVITDAYTTSNAVIHTSDVGPRTSVGPVS